MSRGSVAEKCGPPDALVWRPPDYRELAPIYFAEYLDIDVPGCPGPAYRYGDAVVVFSFDGSVAAVAKHPSAAPSVVDEDALQGCGGLFVAQSLVQAGVTGKGRTQLEQMARAADTRVAAEAQRALERLSHAHKGGSREVPAG